MVARFTRTYLVVLVALIVIVSLVTMTTHHPLQSYVDPLTGRIFGEGGVEKSRPDAIAAHEISGVKGGVIMPKLGNATAKAELGRSTWKLMHTMTLRFPDKPTEDERKALESFFYLTSRLYPCGECAAEFQALLKKYPPQTSSRMVSALWLCSLHNMVNARLKKPEFDCTKLDETYDCGCGPEGRNSTTSPLKADGRKEGDPDKLTGAKLIKGGIRP
ncbi:FAD-linked sulfhydryl oxidase ERV2 OS=Saccharomyces cerevisiae (strain ATCC 204508 / S288c) GN=ERV2 PE=1 SV=1 [Rhizoctonia solani AG-1 IB]|uniref:Sulfhydryl oxidase n=1 Tax=Thanatephorus cucumeris (strain AG1-IB / isolate 7/3/14) TaxID=1108050 RepID=A0A0B7FZD2_THACB|nr:FAD-linked sulfhydryl oxidase ERV2 OS=Saccharomyces cerevisiae (strain ATCC 204508 / S288c) GN=ERV2 PE=1 SV=1 [Rhizoctonia solani AG-1 IB]